MMLSYHYVDQKQDKHVAVSSDNGIQVAKEKQKPFLGWWKIICSARMWAKTFWKFPDETKRPLESRLIRWEEKFYVISMIKLLFQLLHTHLSCVWFPIKNLRSEKLLRDNNISLLHFVKFFFYLLSFSLFSTSCIHLHHFVPFQEIVQPKHR